MKKINAKIVLDDRLGAVAAFVRYGAVFADIGTDHAYLPIHLVQEGKISRAYATDVNAEPIRRAAENVAKHNLSDKIECILCNGFSGLSDKEITDAAICGMGGELICEIIDKAPFVGKPGIRLILQPMTRPHILRKYLLEQGFNITGEKIAMADGKPYICICADYDGIIRSYSNLELELGRLNINSGGTPAFYKLIENKIAAQKKKIDGKKRSGLDTAEDEAIHEDYLRLYKKRTLTE